VTTGAWQIAEVIVRDPLPGQRRPPPVDADGMGQPGVRGARARAVAGRDEPHFVARIGNRIQALQGIYSVCCTRCKCLCLCCLGALYSRTAAVPGQLAGCKPLTRCRLVGRTVSQPKTGIREQQSSVGRRIWCECTTGGGCEKQGVVSSQSGIDRRDEGGGWGVME